MGETALRILMAAAVLSLAAAILTFVLYSCIMVRA
jgi:hypothetical protein